jgi:hypothetical protein
MTAVVRPTGGLAEPEKLVVGKDHELYARRLPTRGLVRRADLQRAGWQRRRDRVLIAAAVLAGEDIGVLKELSQPLHLVCGNGHAPAGREQILDAGHRVGHSSREMWRFGHVQLMHLGDGCECRIPEAERAPVSQFIPQISPRRDGAAQPGGKFAVRDERRPQFLSLLLELLGNKVDRSRLINDHQALGGEMVQQGGMVAAKIWSEEIERGRRPAVGHLLKRASPLSCHLRAESREIELLEYFARFP